MLSVIRDFIVKHSDMIDDSEWYDLFFDAWGQFSSDMVDEILEVLYEVENKDVLQLAACCAYMKWRIDYEQTGPFHITDKAKSWSRLNWMLDAMPHFDQHRNDIINAITRNKDWLGITLKPLDLKYSWNGSPEYDLGWFNPKYYGEENYQ